MPADILVTAPLPDFLYGPLKADFRCHDYFQANDKPGLLRQVAGSIQVLNRKGSCGFSWELQKQRKTALGVLKTRAITRCADTPRRTIPCHLRVYGS